jgi:hypothetical protein
MNNSIDYAEPTTRQEVSPSGDAATIFNEAQRYFQVVRRLAEVEDERLEASWHCIRLKKTLLFGCVT